MGVLAPSHDRRGLDHGGRCMSLPFKDGTQWYRTNKIGKYGPLVHECILRMSCYNFISPAYSESHSYYNKFPRSEINDITPVINSMCSAARRCIGGRCFWVSRAMYLDILGEKRLATFCRQHKPLAFFFQDHGFVESKHKHSILAKAGLQLMSRSF